MTAKKKVTRLSKIRLKAIHFVDEGDNPLARVESLKSRRKAAGGATVPKTTEEILAALPEDERNVLMADLAKAGGPPEPTELEKVMKALDGKATPEALEKIKAALGEKEPEEKAKGKEPPVDGTATDGATGEAPQGGTAVDNVKMKSRLASTEKAVTKLQEENATLKRTNRLAIAKSRAKDEFAFVPELSTDEMGEYLLYVEDNFPKTLRENIEKSLKATHEIVRKSRLMATEGADFVADEGSAMGKANTLAQEMVNAEQAAGRRMSIDKARGKVFLANPDLYVQYEDERAG